jgi:hypothetical protein
MAVIPQQVISEEPSNADSILADPVIKRPETVWLPLFPSVGGG